jgi:hypothetical protein
MSTVSTYFSEDWRENSGGTTPSRATSTGDRRADGDHDDHDRHRREGAHPSSDASEATIMMLTSALNFHGHQRRLAQKKTSPR